MSGYDVQMNMYFSFERKSIFRCFAVDKLISVLIFWLKRFIEEEK